MRPASLVLVFALATIGTACQALLIFSNDERGADGDAAASATADSAPEASARDGGAPSADLSSEPYGFIGAIDEVAIYDRVLTKEGILAHFEASLTGPR